MQAEAITAVAASVSEVLGRTPESQQPLMEAGLDSLGAVELRNSLASRFDVIDLPATLIFDYPSVEALAGFFDSRQQQQQLEAAEGEDVISWPDDGSWSGTVSCYWHNLF